MVKAAQLKSAGNYFLEGNFAPVSEEREFTDMKVVGQIPADLKGSFLRVGPNPVHLFDAEKYHWFDGDGMIHAIEFADGMASYRNRFVQTEGLGLERERGDWVWKGLNSMMDPTPSRVPEGAPMVKNVGNTAFVYHNRTLYALHESSQPHIIALPGLETLGTTDFDGKLAHPFTAHPKVDPRSGEMVTFGYGPMPPYIQYSVIDAAGELVHSTNITIPKPVFMHDFAASANYTLFLDFPLTFDLERAMAGESPLGFEKEHGARIGVVPRFGNDEDVRWFEVEPGVVIHTANAWEEGDEVVLQASRSNTSDVIGAGTATTGDKSDMMGHLHQWRINLVSGAVSEKRLSDVPCDFTRINDNYAGEANRYIYAARFHPTRDVTFDGLLKYDNHTGTSEVYEFGPQCYGGEAVFAPRHDATAEDDGYLVAFVQDEGNDQSECQIIDAARLGEGPVARILIPARVPYGFHAGWVGSS
jgi:carotenoid cleavage dioxygenase-like enzyme